MVSRGLLPCGSGLSHLSVPGCLISAFLVPSAWGTLCFERHNSVPKRTVFVPKVLSMFCFVKKLRDEAFPLVNTPWKSARLLEGWHWSAGGFYPENKQKLPINSIELLSEKELCYETVLVPSSSKGTFYILDVSFIVPALAYTSWWVPWLHILINGSLKNWVYMLVLVFLVSIHSNFLS